MLMKILFRYIDWKIKEVLLITSTLYNTRLFEIKAHFDIINNKIFLYINNIFFYQKRKKQEFSIKKKYRKKNSIINTILDFSYKLLFIKKKKIK